MSQALQNGEMLHGRYLERDYILTTNKQGVAEGAKEHRPAL